MRQEQIFAIQTIYAGEIGQVEISRISLTSSASPEKQTDILIELLYFILKIHRVDIQVLYASATKDQQVSLITLQFSDQTLSNLLVDFTNPTTNDLMRIEITGSEGLYEYQSLQQDSFYSNFLGSVYEPNLDLPPKEREPIIELIEKIKHSIETNEAIYLILEEEKT